jgi:hypothetical protein
LLSGDPVGAGDDDAKSFAGADDFERDLGVLGAVAPAAGLVGPYHAVAVDPASIGKNEIVERPGVGQHHGAVGSVGRLNELGIAIHHCRDRRPADGVNLERRFGGCCGQPDEQEREDEQRAHGRHLDSFPVGA